MAQRFSEKSQRGQNLDGVTVLRIIVNPIGRNQTVLGCILVSVQIKDPKGDVLISNIEKAGLKTLTVGGRTVQQHNQDKQSLLLLKVDLTLVSSYLSSVSDSPILFVGEGGFVSVAGDAEVLFPRGVCGEAMLD